MHGSQHTGVTWYTMTSLTLPRHRSRWRYRPIDDTGNDLLTADQRRPTQALSMAPNLNNNTARCGAPWVRSISARLGGGGANADQWRRGPPRSCRRLPGADHNSRLVSCPSLIDIRGHPYVTGTRVVSVSVDPGEIMSLQSPAREGWSLLRRRRTIVLILKVYILTLLQTM